MKWCRVTSFLFCLSLESGLIVMTIIDFGLLMFIAMIPLLQLESFIAAIDSFGVENFKDIVIFVISSVAVLFAAIRCCVGSCVLCRKDVTNIIRLYFYVSFIADVLFILATALRIGFSNMESPETLMFGTTAGAGTIYYLYCLVAMYSYWERVQAGEADSSGAGKEGESVDKLRNIARKIVEDVGLSVIPEISERGEVSVHVG